MVTGTDGLLANLERQAETVGEGAYRAILTALAARTTIPCETLAPLESAWADRTFHAWYDRPLLLLASLRFLALGDRQHPLYPEVVTNAVVSGLDARLSLAMADPALPELLISRQVQTNEPGRALGWGLVAMVLGLPLRGWALVDLGASAGLNLVGDLTPIRWRVGTQMLTGLDLPSPGVRLGLDTHPLNMEEPETRRWVQACVWPGEAERLGRLEDALAALLRPWEDRSDRPTLRAHTLGEDDTCAAIEKVEPIVEGPIIAFQSVVRDYLGADGQRRHLATMQRWLQGHPRRMWVAFEPTDTGPPSTPMLLEASFARGGQVTTLPLARSRYHPTGCVILPAEVAKLRAAWRS
jgi:hypothetical protein